MEKILPFRLNDTWFGMDLSKIQEVGSSGKISLIPNSNPPIVGLMQKIGDIFPVWSLYSLLRSDIVDIHKCSCFIKLVIQMQIVAIPVDEVMAATTADQNWISFSKYGITMYRSVEKKKPMSTTACVQEVQSVPLFHLEESVSDFHLESVNCTK